MLKEFSYICQKFHSSTNILTNMSSKLLLFSLFLFITLFPSCTSTDTKKTKTTQNEPTTTTTPTSTPVVKEEKATEPAPATPTDPIEAELKAKIQDAIQLCEKADYATFIDRYLNLPATYTAEQKSELVQNLNNSLGSQILTMLKQAQAGKPEWYENKTIANFPLQGVKKPLVFKKKGERWLID